MPSVTVVFPNAFFWMGLAPKTIAIPIRVLFNQLLVYSGVLWALSRGRIRLRRRTVCNVEALHLYGSISAETCGRKAAQYPWGSDWTKHTPYTIADNVSTPQTARSGQPDA